MKGGWQRVTRSNGYNWGINQIKRGAGARQMIDVLWNKRLSRGCRGDLTIRMAIRALPGLTTNASSSSSLLVNRHNVLT